MRLIDADAFLEDMKKSWDWETVDGITATTVLKQVMSDIDNASTVDIYTKLSCEYLRGRAEGEATARPKGEWIIVKDEKWGDNVKCPFCGKELAGTDLNFCVKCGADMRKGGEEE